MTQVDIAKIERPAARVDTPSARLERSTSQTVATNDVTAISWETAVFDNTGGDMWASGSPTLLTLPEAGIYLITGGVIWGSDSSGLRLVRVENAGAILASNRYNPVDTSETTLSTHVEVAAGADITLEVFQTTGGNLAVRSDRSTFLAAQKVAE